MSYLSQFAEKCDLNFIDNISLFRSIEPCKFVSTHVSKTMQTNTDAYFMNGVLSSNFSNPKLSPRGIEELVESFKALNLPFMWRMGPTSSNIEETAAVLQGLNPIDIGTSAIMMLQLDEVSAVKKSLPKVVVVEVRSEKDINSWMSVWAEVFKI